MEGISCLLGPDTPGHPIIKEFARYPGGWSLGSDSEGILLGIKLHANASMEKACAKTKWPRQLKLHQASKGEKNHPALLTHSSIYGINQTNKTLNADHKMLR